MGPVNTYTMGGLPTFILFLFAFSNHSQIKISQRANCAMPGTKEIPETSDTVETSWGRKHVGLFEYQKDKRSAVLKTSNTGVYLGCSNKGICFCPDHDSLDSVVSTTGLSYPVGQIVRTRCLIKNCIPNREMKV
jgi:hypothetical protein